MPTSDDISPSLLFTLAFAAALLLGLALKFWLATRQVRHVARHRTAVPAPFAERIALAAHQKAEIEKWWPIVKAANIKLSTN